MNRIYETFHRINMEMIMMRREELPQNSGKALEGINTDIPGIRIKRQTILKSDQMGCTITRLSTDVAYGSSVCS